MISLTAWPPANRFTHTQQTFIFLCLCRHLNMSTVASLSPLTFLLADALVLHDVLVVQCLQDVDLPGEVGVLFFPVLGLQ